MLLHHKAPHAHLSATRSFRLSILSLTYPCFSPFLLLLSSSFPYSWKVNESTGERRRGQLQEQAEAFSQSILLQAVLAASSTLPAAAGAVGTGTGKHPVAFSAPCWALHQHTPDGDLIGATSHQTICPHFFIFTMGRVFLHVNGAKREGQAGVLCCSTSSTTSRK